MDLQSSLHPYTLLGAHQRNGPVIITEGSGVRVRDNEGREYIDAMAGLWCVNVGWGREEVIEAITRQARRLPYFHSFGSMGNEPAIELGEKVCALAPEGMTRVFFGCTGSDANDTNVKLVWYYNNLLGRSQKKKIISRDRAYHGVTAVAASLSGLKSMHVPFDLPLPGFLHTENPHYYWNAPAGMSEREFSKHLAGELNRLIESEGPDTVAAFIGEPLMGAGGVIPPPEGYWEEIQAVLREHDVLLIADEVICGFGRLGEWFGCDVYGLELAGRWKVSKHVRVDASYSLLVTHFQGAATAGSYPRNQIQIRATMDLADNLEFDVSLYYVDNLSGAGVGSYARLDAHVGWRPSDSVQLDLGAQNLLDSQHPEFVDELPFTQNTEVSTSFYVRLTIRF